jgi:hypothetical protein
LSVKKKKPSAVAEIPKPAAGKRKQTMMQQGENASGGNGQS